MDRRGFLRAMVAGMGAVAVGAIAIPSIAETQVAPVVIDPYAKYKEALRLLDKAIDHNSRLDWRNKTIWSEEDYDGLHETVDQLFDHFLKNFTPPGEKDHAENMKQLKELFSSLDSATIESLRSLPPKFLEGVWPIITVKVILRDYMMPFEHRKLTSFNLFHQTYGHLVLEA